MRRATLIAFASVLALPTVFAAPVNGERFGRIPVDAQSLQPAGTRLGNGFSVAAGAALVGDVFPIPIVYPFRGEPIVDRGWRAILLVKGDPRKVMQAYRRQAAAVGIELRSAPSLCDFSQIDPRIYECFATGMTEASQDPRQVSLSFMRGPGLYGLMSHLNIVYNNSEPPHAVALDPSLTSGATPGPEPPPVPTNWERPAQPGDFFFGDSYQARDGFVAPPLKVERGSLAAAPVGPALPASGPTFAADFGSYDWMAVLRIAGKPSDLVSAYRRQLRSHRRTFGTLSRTVTSQPERDTTMYTFSSELLGGWDHHVEVVRRSSGTWMLVRAYAQT